MSFATSSAMIAPSSTQPSPPRSKRAAQLEWRPLPLRGRGNRRAAAGAPPTANLLAFAPPAELVGGPGGGAAAGAPPRIQKLAHRAALEEVGVLLHPADRLRDRHAVPLLLDAHHVDPARLRALPLLAGRQQRAVLDTPPDRRALRRSVPEDDVPALAVEHVLHRASLPRHLAFLRAPRRLRPRAPPLPHGGDHWHLDLRHVSRAPHLALHPACQYHPGLPARRHAVGPRPDLSDVPHSLLHVAPHGLFQDHPQRARGVRAHRPRHTLPSPH